MDRLIITERLAPRGKRALRQREVTTPLGSGLAASVRTLRWGGESETRYGVAWKNSIASIPAPLTAPQVEQLKHVLGSPLIWLKAELKARFGYRSARAIPAMQLEQVLVRLGVHGSVDWR